MDTHEAEILRRKLLRDLAGEDAMMLKIAQAIPADRMAWRPDAPKCRAIGELAAHAATTADFFLSMASGKGPPASPAPTPATKDELLAAIEAAQARYRAHVTSVPAEDLVRDADFFGTSYPAIELLTWHPWHLIHHRAQVGLYLRLMGAKVPATYGPSGDEG